MRKRFTALSLAMVMAVSAWAVAGCGANSANSVTSSEAAEASTEAPAAETPAETDETYTGTAKGFGGTVTAVIKVSDGTIIECELEGADETPDIGGKALETLADAILKKGSAEVDAISGATYTSNAAKEAVEAALNASRGMGGETAALAFQPGTYQGEAYGNVSTIVVDVEVSDNAIEDIKLVKQGETPLLFDAAWNQVTSDILEYQTLNVDAVSGCTVSSRAIMAAVENALESSGATGLSVLKQPVTKEAKTPQEIEKQADVVVVGGGGAGLVAAISAVEEGAKVVVIEKAPFLGGNLTVFGGIYNTPDPDMQSKVEMSDAVKSSIEKALAANPENEEHKSAIAEVQNDYEQWKADGAKGLFDSAAWFALQTWNSGDKVANKELVDIMCDGAYEGYQWLKDIGVEFEDSVTQGAGSLYQRTHGAIKPNGSGFIEAYVKKLEESKDSCEILMETTAEEFLMDGDKVIGVKAVDADGNTYQIMADSGVILATGGFAGNVELRQKYCEGDKWKDLGEGVMTTNLKAVTGDGILMAEAIGADFVDMDQIQLLHLGNAFTGSTKGVIPYKGRNSNDVIFVNSAGDRFVAEDGRRDVMCNAIIAQDGAYYWMIHDSADIDPYSDTAEEYIKGGYLHRADTLEELAEIIGVPAENLVNAVEQYNAAYDSGKDEFGRTLFTLRLGEAPWFAAKRVASAHHTMGGVKINNAAQVLYPDGNAIPGLYAAGEVCGGIHGGNRVGGNAVDDTVVFGRIAGKNAALD